MEWKEGAMEVLSNFGGDIMIPVTDISRINYNKATWTFVSAENFPTFPHAYYSIRYEPIPTFRVSNEPTATTISTSTRHNYYYATAPGPRLLRGPVILC